jgi:ribosomal protein S18 acetylase RimI-like enzyme
MQARRGELMDALAGEGFMASLDSDPVGLVTWLVDADGRSAEIRALAVAAAHRRQGVGGALLAAAEDALRAQGVRRVWLVTTNDNVDAQRLYASLGYRVAQVREGAIDELRRTLKPSIPEIGEHGIPIRDEIELERELSPG